ncbi:MAG TPA: hypothetical protein VD788_04065, partial [Candidatus Polarisedimenticolaceae bacterium]|nr:hypothetical protein [Candidatus Polarisedimenticolaceae bacterium]
EVPPLAELPLGSEALVERLAPVVARKAGREVERDSRKNPRDMHARPYHDIPLVVHGRTFFDLRERVATALFRYPDYRDWALDRLADEARAELEALERRYRTRIPGASDEAIERAVRLSQDGRRIRERAVNPTPRDLSRHLAAWLGDLPAQRLLADWEARRIDELVRRPGPTPADDGFVDQWLALRQLLFVPSYARELTPLVLTRSPDGDRIGFYRIVLPRPGWFYSRVRNYRDHAGASDLPFDLIPDRPAAFETMRELLADQPDLVRHLAAAGYRVRAIDYRSRLKPRKQRPDRALDELRVALELAVDERLISLELDLRTAASPTRPCPLLALRATSQGDQPAAGWLARLQSSTLSRSNNARYSP